MYLDADANLSEKGVEEFKDILIGSRDLRKPPITMRIIPRKRLDFETFLFAGLVVDRDEALQMLDVEQINLEAFREGARVQDGTPRADKVDRMLDRLNQMIDELRSINENTSEMSRRTQPATTVQEGR